MQTETNNKRFDCMCLYCILFHWSWVQIIWSSRCKKPTKLLSFPMTFFAIRMNIISNRLILFLGEWANFWKSTHKHANVLLTEKKNYFFLAAVVVLFKFSSRHFNLQLITVVSANTNFRNILIVQKHIDFELESVYVYVYVCQQNSYIIHCSTIV